MRQNTFTQIYECRFGLVVKKETLVDCPILRSQLFLIPDWSQELQLILILAEVFQWPVLLLSILGMYNGTVVTKQSKKDRLKESQFAPVVFVFTQSLLLLRLTLYKTNIFLVLLLRLCEILYMSIRWI